MIGRAPDPPAAPPAVTSRLDVLRHALLETLPGRLLIGGALARTIVSILRAIGMPSNAPLEFVNLLASFALALGGGYFALKLAALARRRLLWRVRRKLILSYVFIGVVPVLLLVGFFVLCGLLLFFHVSSYLVQTRLRSLTEQAQFEAQAAALELQRAGSIDAAQTVLVRREASFEVQYPGVSMAVVPASASGCAGPPAIGATGRSGALPHLSAGPWMHLNPPEALPDWVTCNGFAGILAYIPENQAAPTTAQPEDTDIVLSQTTRLAIRGVAFPPVARPGFAVVVDVPVTESVARQLREDAGIQLRQVSVVQSSEEGVHPAVGLPVPELAGAQQDAGGALSWVTLVDYTDWATGRTAPVAWAIALNIPQVYERLSATQARIGNRSFGQILLLLLTIVAALFLVIEFVALVMGFALAKSITGSVHELFVGTEKVRNGDFSHQIKIDARDQMGDLASSFNQMTTSVVGLLRDVEVKERLQEELRIAHKIQMSLLPTGPVGIPGVSVTATCRPAREVGGDYYDLFPLGPRRLGVLVADVAGKGTSAALYMAELKGLMLALSQTHQSPRELLIEANRIITAHIDARSFITMTYAVLDLEHGTIVYARAGHTPLLHLPAGPGPRRAHVLTPDGMVLGLKIDSGEHFGRLLEEKTLDLSPGDLFVFFTDGISEAMNPQSECFEESRLGALVEQYGDLSCDEIRQHVFDEVKAFTQGASQHDDMTMILVRVDEVGERAAPVELARARA
jgi:serine phosphatase RsbU (regulator of sigma subunit)/HAMP domain-containing protein